MRIEVAVVSGGLAAKMAAGDYRFNGMQDQEYIDEYDHPNAMGGGGGGYLDQGPNSIENVFP